MSISKPVCCLTSGLSTQGRFYTEPTVKRFRSQDGGVFIKHLAPGIEFITHTETIARDPLGTEVAGSTLVTSLKPLVSAHGVKGLGSLSPVGPIQKSRGTLLCLHAVTCLTSEALICRHLGPTWLLESSCPEIPAQGKGSSQALV